MARHEDRRHDRRLAPALAGGLIKLSRATGAACAAVLTMLLLAPAAPAKSPDDFSAADQYVETLPTSQGPSATKDRKAGRTRLPAAVKAKLDSEGGKDAAALQEIATSDQFGAPQAQGGSADKKRETSSRSTTAVPSASVKAVRDSGEDMLWLLFALIAITGLMVGAVAYQRHKNSKSG
jgi:hypothetical protein